MKSISLVFPGEPRAIQSVKSRTITPKAGKAFIHHYQPKHNEDWKSYIRVAAQSQLPLGWTPIQGAVALGRVLFLFAPIAGLTKAQREAIEAGKIVLKDTKPDLNDNLFKGLMDALEGIVYVNDSRTCRHMGDAVNGYHKAPRSES
jgi:Holliday junction resolvase RusA-like endonuclease